jgi:16S rRNA (adenine1518-N6/adenine1519-N6)-dimethyltransferase
MKVRERLLELGLAPSRARGQNFLTDEGVATRIAIAACEPIGGVTPSSVMEIGPGLGVLTRPLADRARVLSIEIDAGLANALRADPHSPFSEGRHELVHADALEVDWRDTLCRLDAPRAIAGNVPYSITGALLRRATEVADLVDRVVLMVQREVADRIVAGAGTEAYGGLSVFLQRCFTCERVLTVGPGAFHPRPKVASAVVRLTPRANAGPETSLFRDVVHRAFGARRKTLRNAWRGLASDDEVLRAWAERARIDLDRRGETLDVGDFERFCRLAPEMLGGGESR